MKRINPILFLLFLCPLVIQAQFNLFGSATFSSGSCIQLTPNLQGRAGCAWSPNQVNFANSFTMTFDLFLGSNPNGADGIALVFQAGTASGCGNTGGTLGASGIPNSVVIEFDTYNNGFGDFSVHHTSVYTNGQIPGMPQFGPFFALPGGTPLSNNTWHTVVIDWIANTNTLQLSINGFSNFSISSNFVSQVFNGNTNITYGFTAGTGSLTNQQMVCTPIVLQAEIFELEVGCEGKDLIFLWEKPEIASDDGFSLEYSSDLKQIEEVFPMLLESPDRENETYRAVLKDFSVEGGFFRISMNDGVGSPVHSGWIKHPQCNSKPPLLSSLKNGEDFLEFTVGEAASFYLVDAKGSTVMTKIVLAGEANRFPTEHIAEGIYFLRVVSGMGRVEIEKLLIRH